MRDGPFVTGGMMCAMTPRPARAAAAAALLTAATLLVGCSSGSEPSPPAGVDGLSIPTSDPQADDYVDTIDHPWLRLAPGSVWTFEDGLSVHAFLGTVHDGIATTIVTTGPETAPADHLAQDVDGNVWWLGRQAEVGGEVTWFDEPGLWLPATPRRGDGWTMAAAPGLDVRAQIIDDGEQVDVPAGDYDDAIVIEIVEDGVTRRDTLVRGVGLVRRNDAGLVAHDEPR